MKRLNQFCAVVCYAFCVTFCFALLPLVGFVNGPASSAQAEQGDSLTAPLRRLEQGVKRITLSNGLRVLLYNRPQVPIFSAQVWVKVGGVDEQVGATGISHLLEHMAFKGTTSIGTKDYSREKPLLEELEQLVVSLKPGENLLTHPEYLRINTELSKIVDDNAFSRTYQQLGAVGLNAATSKDYTMYDVSLPTEAFPVWCRMEGDRLVNPVFRQFYKEREVVQEERRSRTDDNPSGLSYEALLSTAYWVHPNRLPVIGWSTDLKRMTATQVAELHRTYYRPDNIVVSLVGDLEVEGLEEKLEECFGQLPRATTPLPEVRVEEPKQNGERSVVVEFDAEPSFIIAYHKPVYPDPTDVHFSVLHEVLGGGRSSLFNKELVLGKQLATSVSSTEAPGERFPSLFAAVASPRKGVSNERLRDEVQALFDRLKREAVPASELVAAKRRVQVSLIAGLADNDGLASMLARFELLQGDWRVFLRMYETLLQTTAEDLMQLSQKYLTINNRTYVRVERPKVPQKSSDSREGKS